MTTKNDIRYSIVLNALRELDDLNNKCIDIILDNKDKYITKSVYRPSFDITEIKDMKEKIKEIVNDKNKYEEQLKHHDAIDNLDSVMGSNSYYIREYISNDSLKDFNKDLSVSDFIKYFDSVKSKDKYNTRLLNIIYDPHKYSEYVKKKFMSRKKDIEPYKDIKEIVMAENRYTLGNDLKEVKYSTNKFKNVYNNLLSGYKQLRFLGIFLYNGSKVFDVTLSDRYQYGISASVTIKSTSDDIEKEIVEEFNNIAETYDFLMEKLRSTTVGKFTKFVNDTIPNFEIVEDKIFTISKDNNDDLAIHISDNEKNKFADILNAINNLSNKVENN